MVRKAEHSGSRCHLISLRRDIDIHKDFPGQRGQYGPKIHLEHRVE